MAQEMAMLHDIARCSACRACMVACKQWHDLPADMSTPFEGQYQSHATLTPTTWNLIRMTERTDAKGKFHWDFVKVQCMHCDDPACAKGCPEEAIDKLDSGAVVINADKCVGCGYCVANCPFDVPKINKETHKSTKCDLCFDRIEEGMTPSCAKTCTADALQFAPYEEIARQRVKELQEDGYPDQRVQPTGRRRRPHDLRAAGEAGSLRLLRQAKTPVSIDIWKDVVRPLGKVAGVGALVGLLGLAAVKGMRGKKDDDENGKGEK